MKRFLQPQTITTLIFLLLLVLRLPGLENSPAEYHVWRQSDTEAIARNFTQVRFNIFYPQLNYDGPPPNYAQLEFQITTFLIACLYRLFGYHYILARIVPLLFFAGSAYFLYRLAKDLGGQVYGWLTLMVYGSFPFCIYFSRAIMPESAALFFLTAGVYSFLSWQKAKDNLLLLILSAGSIALAVSQKIPAIYIGMPMAYLLWRECGFRTFRNVYVWSYVLLALAPPFFYFYWLQGVAEADYVTGIATNLLLPGWFKEAWLREGWPFLLSGLQRAITPFGLGLAVGGVLLLNPKQDPLLCSWAAAASLEIVGVAAVIRLDYYLLLATPILALLVAKALWQIVQSCFGRAVIGCLVVVLLLLGWQVSELEYKEEPRVLQKAAFIQLLTVPDELLVIGSYSPHLLNLSHRYGWRANIFYPGEPHKEMEYFALNSAAYFIVVDGQIEGDEDGSYYQYLKRNFREIAIGHGLSIFDLQTRGG